MFKPEFCDSGSGLAGRFTVKGMKRKVKKRKKVVKEEKEDKDEDVVEYKPAKSARYLQYFSIKTPERRHFSFYIE